MEAATEIQKLQQVSEIEISYSNPIAKVSVFVKEGIGEGDGTFSKRQYFNIN